MSNIWREMGSPEGQDCFGKLGSCQSSALERNYPLCLALLQLYTHQRQTDPNPSKKINNYINREKRQSQPVLSNQRPPHQSCPVTRQFSIPLWKSVDFSQWPQHQTKTKTKTLLEETEPFLGPAPHGQLFQKLLLNPI